jgi:amino acid transporter/nucleotide-binding universal stress UspA family protein
MKKFETEVRLNREMSLMDVTLIGVGAMIGAGIFVLTGIAAGVAGPGLILAFLLNGVVTLFTAMAYAELGSCFHDAGGGYLWVKEGLPRWNGFLAGWMSWFAHAVACSLYALGFGAYFGYVLKEFGIILPHWGVFSPEKTLATIIAFLFAYINFRGASETGKIGNLVTISKIVILMIFIGFGLNLLINRPDWKDAFTPFLPHGWDGIFKAMGLTFIAFEGYEVIAQCSEEIRSPRKNIPRAVFLSIAIVLPIYLLVGITALGSIKPVNMTPWDYLALHKETALVELARQLFSGGGVIILVGGLISTMSALNATVYSSSRVAFAMGRDRNFPAFFSKVHSKNFTPHWAILVSSVIIVLMAVSLPIEDVASAADIMFLLLFLQVNIAMIRLRKKRPELDRGFSVPLFPGLSILGILMLLFLAVYMFNYSPMAWVVTVAWIFFGIGVYEVYASKREVEHIQKVKALERIERKEYRILVCLSNPQSVNSLTHTAIAVARKHNAEIIFLHVIEVHEGQHLMAGLQETARAKPLFEEAESLASASGVPARSIIQVSHRISQGIVQTAAMENCNFILIRRQKQPTFLDRVFSSLVDTVLQKSTSEVAVLHGEFEVEKIRKILIPFGTSIHTQLATEIAPALADYFKAELRIVVVFDPDIPPIERDNRLGEIRQVIQDNSLSAQLEMVIGKDVLKGILGQAKDADLVLMGGRTGDFLELLFAKSLSQEITEQVKCPVLWVKEYQESRSLWTTLLKPYNGGERMK